MDKLEAYSYLFTDTLYSSLVLSPHSELVIDVMHAFGEYDLKLILLLATLASSLGHIINWLLGIVFRTILKIDKVKKDSQNSLAKGEQIYRKYFYWTPILAFLPLWGSFVSLMAGIFRVRAIYIFIMVFISELLYYSYKLFFR
jgi:membrane protein YqaA with SNARE-associated domain